MSEAQKSTTTVQQIGPIDGPTVCSKCGEKIVNALTTDEQNVYHPHCFVCSNCGQTLAGGFFYKSKNAKINSSRSSSVEATRFCEDCYKKIAPKWFVINSSLLLNSIRFFFNRNSALDAKRSSKARRLSGKKKSSTILVSLVVASTRTTNLADRFAGDLDICREFRLFCLFRLFEADERRTGLSFSRPMVLQKLFRPTGKRCYGGFA